MKKQALMIIVLAALVVAACGGKASQQVPQDVEQQVPAEMPEAPADAQAPVDAQAPAEESVPAEAQPVVEQPASTSGMVAYEATKGLFTLSIPASWAITTDTDTIDNTAVDTATAPDGNAFVQVLTNRVNDSLTNVLKGQVTLDYMKRLYGKDLRVSKDVTLDDGREKLEWQSKMNELSGTTYFDTGKNYLYIYTVASKDEFQKEYKSILKEVEDSFSY